MESQKIPTVFLKETIFISFLWFSSLHDENTQLACHLPLSFLAVCLISSECDLINPEAFIILYTSLPILLLDEDKTSSPENQPAPCAQTPGNASVHRVLWS